MNSYLFIATMLFLPYSNSLDLLLNMEKLKSFISPDCIGYSTLSLWTSVILEVLFFTPKILGIILGLFSIESFHLDSMSNFIWKKLCQLSSTWKCLEIPCVFYFSTKDTFYTGLVYSSSLSMVFCYSITTKHY